jgi:hypothetical protein
VPVPPPHAEMKTESSSKRKSDGSFDNNLIMRLKKLTNLYCSKNKGSNSSFIKIAV